MDLKGVNFQQKFSEQENKRVALHLIQHMTVCRENENGDSKRERDEMGGVKAKATIFTRLKMTVHFLNREKEFLVDITFMLIFFVIG